MTTSFADWNRLFRTIVARMFHYFKDVYIVYIPRVYQDIEEENICRQTMRRADICNRVIKCILLCGFKTYYRSLKCGNIHPYIVFVWTFNDKIFCWLKQTIQDNSCKNVLLLQGCLCSLHPQSISRYRSRNYLSSNHVQIYATVW